MRTKLAAGSAASAVVVVFMAGSAVAEAHADVHPTPAAIIQVLKAFDNPEGAIFSADGNHLFISNAAGARGDDRSTRIGWTEGEGDLGALDGLDCTAGVGGAVWLLHERSGVLNPAH